jgi:hypothetical protein
MPVASPDFNPGDGTAYYPPATAADGSFGFGFQVVAIYNARDMIALGASYTGTQWFEDFEFNSAHANPGLPDFGTHRDITFAMDVPAVAAGGVKIQALPNMSILGEVLASFRDEPGLLPRLRGVDRGRDVGSDRCDNGNVGHQHHDRELLPGRLLRRFESRDLLEREVSAVVAHRHDGNARRGDLKARRTRPPARVRSRPAAPRSEA